MHQLIERETLCTVRDKNELVLSVCGTRIHEFQLNALVRIKERVIGTGHEIIKTARIIKREPHGGRFDLILKDAE